MNRAPSLPGAHVLDRLRELRDVRDHDGRSGARIQRGRLDGHDVYVKTARVAEDLTAQLTGAADREGRLLAAGVFDRLPSGIEVALVGSFVVDDLVVTVSRDVSDAVLGWDHQLSGPDVDVIFDRVGAMHRTFRGRAPDGLCPLGTRLTLFGPAGRSALGASNPSLADAVDRGWGHFADLVAGDVATVVSDLLAEPAPLLAALRRAPQTLVHGDLWLVNLGLRGDTLILLDWGLATEGPSALDFVEFCLGASSNVAIDRVELLGRARQACPDDDAVFGAACIWALMELGWNKALDAVTHADAGKRAFERADLDFWVERAGAALDQGVLG